MYDTKNEPMSKLWTLSDDDEYLQVHQFYQCITEVQDINSRAALPV